MVVKLRFGNFVGKKQFRPSEQSHKWSEREFEIFEIIYLLGEQALVSFDIFKSDKWQKANQYRFWEHYGSYWYSSQS